MRHSIDPTTATLELRPEFEAALEPPRLATCPHCRREAAARFEIDGGHHDEPRAGPEPQPSSACPKHGQQTIARFPRHHDRAGSLPPRERAKLGQIARAIVQSHRPGCTPIRSVLLIGHADHDPAREEQEPGFLARISRHRAMAVQRALIHLIGDPGLASAIHWTHRGDGDRFPAVPDAQTEADRCGTVGSTLSSIPARTYRPNRSPGRNRSHSRRSPAGRSRSRNRSHSRRHPSRRPSSRRRSRHTTDGRCRPRSPWPSGLESAFGTKMPRGSNNPFGIKAGKGQPFVEASTREVVSGKSVMVVAKFRKYDSIAQAFDEHGRLLATHRPYARAMSLAANPDAFADALNGVYATDPRYGAALKSIMKKDNLYQYDKA